MDKELDKILTSIEQKAKAEIKVGTTHRRKRWDRVLDDLKGLKESVADASLTSLEVKRMAEGFLDKIKDLQADFPSEMDVWVKNPVKEKKSVKVSNLGDIKFPKPVSEVSVKDSKWMSKYISPVVEQLKQVTAKILRVEIVNNTSPTKAIAVRVVSKDGKKFIEPVGGGAVFGTAASGSSTESKLQGYVGKTGEWENVLIDPSTHTMQTITHPHHEMHAGSFYYVKGWVDVDGAGTNTDFLWCVPDTLEAPHAQWNIAGEAEFTLSLYEGVTVSDQGAVLVVFNVERNSGNVASVLAFLGPTLAGGVLGDGGQGGTLVWAGKIGSGKNATGSRSTSYEFVGKRDNDYWFQLTKIPANVHWLDYDFNWYEHSPRS